MKRFGWKRLSPPGSKIETRWVHATGWEVRHCGHMTAIRPYFARQPGDTSVMVLDHNGVGFRTLAKSFDAIEELLTGGLVLWRDPSPGRYGAHARIVTKAQRKQLDKLVRRLHPGVCADLQQPTRRRMAR